MAQSGKGKLNFRCPSCFMRDLDIDMFYDKDKKDVTGYVKEGYAFSPMFTLGYKKMLKDKEVFSTWLNLAKEN